MITEIRVRNFQSLHDVSIGLGGLTAIVGETNAGKSALIRAVNAAASNQRGDSFITDEADFTTVELAIIDRANQEWVLSWSKYRKHGGEYFYRPANTTDDQQTDQGNFANWTGLRILSLARGNFVVSLNFQGQKDNDFLLSASDSIKSKILGEITNASLILLAGNQVKKDSQVNNTSLQIHSQDKAEVDSRLAQEFTGLREAREHQEYARTVYLALVSADKQLDMYAEKEIKLSAIVEEHNKAMRMDTFLNTVYAENLRQQRLLDERVVRTEKEFDRMTEYENRIMREVAIAKDSYERMQLLKSVPSMGNLEQRVTDFHALVSYLEVLDDLLAKTTLAETALESTAVMLDKVDSALEKVKVKLKVCPLCGEPFRTPHENSSN